MQDLGFVPESVASLGRVARAALKPSSAPAVAVRLLLLAAFLAGWVPAAPAQRGPSLGREVHRDVSPPLRELPGGDNRRTLHEHEHAILRLPRRGPRTTLLRDPVEQSSYLPATASVGLGFEGLGQGEYGMNVNGAPPDTNGAVGATQYVQWVNVSLAVFDKATGRLLTGPTPGKNIWSGFGGGCQNNNDGDPIVVYDKLADRWVLTQFSVSTLPFLQCVAVSTSPDATGTYYRYSFQFANFPDYPKLGVWPDAYYMSFNMFNGNSLSGAQVCALDRNAMLNGQPAGSICFQQPATVAGLLPADLDGTTPPPAGSPGYFLGLGSNSSLNLYKFHADFATPANASFTLATTLTVANFDELCGGNICIPQPGTSNQLDSLADRLMYRLAYRNFGSYESLVANHSVATSTAGGVRWYEIRNPGGTATVFQQGTFSPDSSYRWMGSIAMDKAGDIALGYSVSSVSVNPSIAFTGRAASDALGTMQGETLIVSGSGSQTVGLNRWGDYSSMTVDPVDDCTFWYTQLYLKANGIFNWNTRIANFSFPACQGVPGDTTAPTTSLTAPLNNATVSGSVSVTAIGSDLDSPTLSKMEIYLDNVLKTSNTNANSISYTWDTTTAANGTHTLYSKAYDAANNVGTSSTVTVTVANTITISQLIQNPGFETGNMSNWTLAGVQPTSVSTAQKHGGTYSALVGLASGVERKGDWSLYQSVSIPSNATSATLTFWYWPATVDIIKYDWQEAQVQSSTGALLAQIFKVCSNTRTWTQVTYDLTPYRGQTIRLYFNDHGDGYGDLTYMYLDDINVVVNFSSDTTAPTTSLTAPLNNATVSGSVSVTAIGSDLGSPTLSKMEIYLDNVLKASNTNVNSISYTWDTTTATNGTHTLYSKAYDAANNVGTSSTVTVTVANTISQLIQNPGFETGNMSNWTLAGVQPTSVSTAQKHGGTYSALVGLASGVERKGDWSLYQSVSIPSNATSATLTFWYWPATVDIIKYDWQEAQVQSSTGALLAQIFKVCSNTRTWTQVTYDLTPYRGQTIRLYFNDHGDGYGDLTYMYLDDINIAVH